MFDPKLKEALGRVQKPGRYTGGEPGSVYKDKNNVDVRFAFCFPARHRCNGPASAPGPTLLSVLGQTSISSMTE